MENNKDVDAFIVFTDLAPQKGRLTPSEALHKYRASSEKREKTKMIVCVFSQDFSLADPEDPLMLDICGFDCHTPEIILHFIRN